MQSEAVFENIGERISNEIHKAQKSIFIAVAWFTNKKLFSELLNKARGGCSVSLIISDDRINSNSQIEFEQLEKYNSKCYRVGNGETELMHNKFCIIDYSTVITGSYNWSYKAENNFENVIINYGDTALAEQFISEFNQIRKQYYPHEVKEEIVFPLLKIVQRLEILKNYILLEDVEELKKETQKLSGYNFNADVAEIIDAIQTHEFVLAISKIQIFLSQNQQITIWNDPEISALKLQIKNLENQLNAFDNEKIELEKLFSEFQYRHTTELGSIILEILKLRKNKFEPDTEKFAEAQNDFNQYNEQIEIEKAKTQFKITEEEKQELKKKFRKATFLCHPDKVDNEFKSAAEKIFIDLKAAYEANDLKRVSDILSELDKGNFFRSQSETISEKEMLRIAIARLRAQIKSLENELIKIKENKTYKTISSISNWDIYFISTKEKLIQELQELKKEVKN